MIKRIGLYGGTFNPIHLGHLNLAIEMLEKHSLAQIYFCPAAMNPHKTKDGLVSPDHRVAMLKLAIAEIPQFSILDTELKRGAPSYTIETVKELLGQELVRGEERRYYLILGQDAVASFHNWHRVHELVALVPLLIGARQSTYPYLADMQDSLLREALQRGMTETRRMDIASTEIRTRLAQKKYCGHLVPTKVLDYIYANRLYYVS